MREALIGTRAGTQINKLEMNVSQPTPATALAIADELVLSVAEFLPPARRVRERHKDKSSVAKQSL
jgi:hypothetical protein